jgi:ACS family glucarate transporter-like MFS transporter/ACS family D-galactonate transporter-like MFS transporter
MVGIGIAPGFGLLLVAQLIMGVAQAGLMPAACNSIGHWMPLAQRSLACGILGAGLQVGAILSSGLSALMIDLHGWRWVFIAFALPGFLWSLGFLFRFRDRPSEILPPDSAELALIRSGVNFDDSKQEQTGELTTLLSIAGSSTVWWLCGQQICRAAGYEFFASWFPTFLQKTRGVTVQQSGYMQGMVLVGALIGCILGGIVTDWVWRRTGNLSASRSGVGAASLATCAIVTLIAWFVESTGVAVFLLSLGAFCAAFAGACAFAATIDIGGPRVGQVSGLMNMSGNLAAALCPVLVAELFQMTHDWNLVLLCFAAVFFLGAICWLFVNPQRHFSRAAEPR